MENESPSPADGPATAVDLPAIPNGHPLETTQTQTLTQPQEPEPEYESPDEDSPSEALKEEIQHLKKSQSDLQAKIQDMAAKMDHSEVEKQAIASHASYLEGELYRTQQDLTSASFVAESAEREAASLRKAARDMETENASLVTAKAALESQVRDLESDLEAARAKAASVESKRELEVSTLEIKVKDLQQHLRVSREKEAAAAADLKMLSLVKEELEKTVKELKKRNSELEGEISGFASNMDRDMEVDQKDKDVDDAEGKGFRVSWATAAGAMASTATVAATATVIYLRHARQR